MVWSMLMPLAMLVILTVVFSGLLSVRTGSYPLFLFPGLVAWQFFAQTSSAIVSSPVVSADLFRRIRMARTSIALAALIGGVVHFVFGALVCIALMLFVQPQLNWGLLTIPAAIVIMAVFTLGWGLMGAALAVDFIDVPGLYQSVLPLLMFATPVVYPTHLLAPSVARVLEWNPLALMMELFRTPLVDGHAAPWSVFVTATLVAVLALGAGWFAFLRKIDVLSYRS
jgi:ABC-type polysaccharide/polyol phosphate export permease